MGKIPIRQPAAPGKLPAVSAQASTDDMTPTFCFSHVEDKGKYSLPAWNSSEITDLIACLKKMEARTWEQIRASGGKLGDRTGLGYQVLKDPKRLGLSPDLGTFEVRVCRKKRVIAFREGRVCNILRFDRDHSTSGK